MQVGTLLFLFFNENDPLSMVKCADYTNIKLLRPPSRVIKNGIEETAQLLKL